MRKQVVKMFLLMLALCAFTGFSLPAFALTAYIPHVTGGAGNESWKDYLQADNTGLVDVTYELTLYNYGSAVYGPVQYTVSRLSENAPLDLKALASEASWGVITYTSEALLFRACYEYNGGPAAEFTLNHTLSGTLGFFFSAFSANGVSKGIAVTNTDAVPAVGTIFALGDGAVLGNAQITIPGRTRVLGVYSQWFPSLAFDDVQKLILVTTSPYLCGITMQSLQKGSELIANLLFTAAQPVTQFSAGSSDYSGTWEGTWQSSGFGRESGSVIMYLVQSGDSFTGTMDITNTDAGDVEDVPVTGTISGNVITFQASYNYMGHIATINYTSGTISGTTITGIYAEQVDGFPYDAGTFSMTKVQ